MNADNVTELPWETRQTREIINLRGGKKDILLALAVIVVPNVILTAILLGLILHNQVSQTYSQLPGVPDPLARESSAFLVDFSATRLLTVASWTSTLTSLLPSFAMVLVSFPVARTIMNASKDKNTDDLPTPYQLSMLLSVLSGSIGSLWDWFKYRGWEKRERVNGIAKGSIIWLLFILVLGYLIVIADTWLHATTSTIQLLQALPGPSVSYFGRGFYSDLCNNVTSHSSCSVYIGNHGPHFYNSTEVFGTLANTSSQNLVLSFPYRGQTYALITDSNVPENTGYQARTFAVTTQCALISSKCQLPDGWQNSFNCSAAFQGTMPNYKYNDYINPTWGLAGVEFFQDPGLANNFSTIWTPANPVYIGAYGMVLGANTGSSLLLNSSEFIQPETPGLGFLMGCNMTAYDIEYVWYNGSISVQKMVQSNTSVVNVLTEPFVVQLANLVNLAQSAASEATPDEFIASWTTGFSIMVLSLAAGIMSPRTTIKEQARVSTLITRVPKAPLAVLVLLTLIYAAIGVLLACIAARAGPGLIKNVQGRLSIASLVAKCFESEERCDGPTKEIQDLFEENEFGARDHKCPKVAIVASGRGGWKYNLIGQDERGNSVTLTPRGNQSFEPYVQTVSIS